MLFKKLSFGFLNYVSDQEKFISLLVWKPLVNKSIKCHTITVFFIGVFFWPSMEFRDIFVWRERYNAKNSKFSSFVCSR